MLKRIFISLFFLVLPLSAYSDLGPLEQLGKQLDQTAAYMVIMTKYANDPLLNPFDIRVKIENGTAVLVGVVDTDLQYDRAVMIAQETKTIDKVDASNLKVKDGKKPLDDLLITAKIKGVLLKNKYVNGENVVIWPIKISTKDGVVYVVGKIDEPEQKTNILNLIKGVEGVKEVRSDLQLSAPSKP